MDIGHENNEQRQYKSPIRIVFEKLSPTSNSSTVYGEPIEVEGKKVVPVSKVTVMVGGGAGSAKSKEEINEDKESTDNKECNDCNDGNHGEGEGGGGMISVKPVGVYEITSKKTRFIPAVDLSLLFMLGSGLFFIMSLVSLRKNKHKSDV